MLARTLCSLATATPNKDDRLKKNLMHRHASTRKNWRYSHPNTLSLIAFVPKRVGLRRVRTRPCSPSWLSSRVRTRTRRSKKKKKKHRLFGLEDTSSLHVERIFDQLQAAFFWTRSMHSHSVKVNRKPLIRVVQLRRASLACGRQARVGPTSHNTCT